MDWGSAFFGYHSSSPNGNTYTPVWWWVLIESKVVIVGGAYLYIGQPPQPHDPPFWTTWLHIKLHGKYGQPSTVQLSSLRNDNAPHLPVLVVGGRTTNII